MAAPKRDTQDYRIVNDGVNYEMALIATGCWYVFQDGHRICLVYEQDGKYHSEHKEIDGPTFVGPDPVTAAHLYLNYRKTR